MGTVKAKEKGGTKKIVVAGDSLRDHNIYQGVREAPHMTSGQETMMLDRCGGACLLHSFIEAVGQETKARIEEFHQKLQKETDKDKQSEYRSGIDKLVPFEFVASLWHLKDIPICNNHSYALWGACKRYESSKEKVWRMTSLLGYGTKDHDTKPCDTPKPTNDNGNPDIILFDDGALGFRFRITPHDLDQLIRKHDAWIVLKTSYPLASGKLWYDLKGRFSDRLVVIVSIGDLRRQGVGVRPGLSWERTALELASELKNNAAVNDILKCRHLIIPFGSEGALWIDNRNKIDHSAKPVSRLIYDPALLEREWGQKIDGEAYGYMSCFTAALAYRLLHEGDTDDFLKGIQAGLASMRTLRTEGHGDANKNPDFPFAKVAKQVLDIPGGYYSWVSLQESDGDQWSVISGNLGKNSAPLYGLARRVALFGEHALSNIPYARFGKLFTVDRAEIESLRSIELLIKGYDAKKKETKPLSIAVFGPPGAGKSFGIKQIAKSVLVNSEILEFNLSQFSEPEQHPDQLTGAFHEIRDCVLRGKTAIVFWDEFDTGQLRWLQYLLAPMQDGTFREGQANHPLGRCIFIFAGGTSRTMRDFALSDEKSEAYKEFKMKKVSDFISRLSGSLDVLGPNKRKDDKGGKRLQEDICFPIRRALIMRVALGLDKDAKMEVDSGVINAFLEINEYRHGARSLEKLAQLSQRPGEKGLRSSGLSPDKQISLLVDRDEFIKIMNRDQAFKMNAEGLAVITMNSTGRSANVRVIR